MAIKLRATDDDNLLEVQASGTLTHADYQRFVPEFERRLPPGRRLRVLFEMKDFHGWKAAALWDDLKFDLRHFADIERLAMVGDKRWERGMAAFCRPFTTAKIRYFDRRAIAEARRWLAEKPAEPVPVLRVLQTKEQTRAFYDKISGVYDLLSDRSEAPMREAGLAMLQLRPGEHVLEIGFGTGHSLVALAQAVGQRGQVLGLDLSPAMVKLAQANLARAGLEKRARLRCGDATRLPWRAGSLDAIFMSFALELFDTPEIPTVLRECRRVLRPGGRIVVVGMSKDGKPDPLVGVFEWTHRHFPNFLDCRPIYVRAALEAAGFAITQAETKHMWIPVEIVRGAKAG